MISIAVKYFSCLRGSVSVRSWLRMATSFFLYCKVYSFRKRIYAITFYVGCMSSFPQWQKKKIWSQNICSKFCWMLTADSDAFRFWPCEMLFLAYATPCISNIQTAGKALAVCIWICPGKQMLFRSVTSMQSFFLVFHGMRLHEIFDCILMASREVTQWFVSRECLLVYNGKENSIKLSNQLFPKDLWIIECISLLLWAHHNSLYVCTRVCVSVYACLQICLCFCEWVHTFLSVCCCATLCELKIECHKILFICIILRKQGFYVFLLFDFYVILNHEKCRILKDRVNI